MPTVNLLIRGEPPAPWGSNEWDWRRAVAQEARAARVPAAISPDSTFAVDITFYLPPSKLGRADLDNLAKPVLDTLFECRNAQVADLSLTGALFAGIDDDRVFKLQLEKRAGASSAQQGADVRVTWG